MKGHYSVVLLQPLLLCLHVENLHRNSLKQPDARGVRIVSQHYPRTTRQIPLPGHLPPHADPMENPNCFQIKTTLCHLFYRLRKGRWRRSKKVLPLADPAQQLGNIHIACHGWNLSNPQSPTNHLHLLHCSARAQLVEVVIRAGLIPRRNC